MNELYKPLKERQKWLESVIRMEEATLKKAPQGRLKIVKNNDRIQYYLRTEKNPGTGYYLRKNQRDLAAAVAQRDLSVDSIRAARLERDALVQLFQDLPLICLEDLYDRLHEGRKELVTPIIKTPQILRREFEEEIYKKKGFAEGESVYYTAKGERVRSKSEVLIADTLERRALPYHYEHPLWIRDRLLHPDFTILDLKTGKKWLWEHLGMLDSPTYAERAVERMLLYILNGYIPGKNLILSVETSRYPLNARQVLMLIKENIEG